MDQENGSAQPPLEERIRIKAYMIWEDEGRPDGRALAHWVLATELVEREQQETSENRAATGKPTATK
jgi:hypothetical protein